MDSDFQCRMQQPHPKIGIILFFVRCRMRLSHPTLKIMVRVNRPLSCLCQRHRLMNSGSWVHIFRRNIKSRFYIISRYSEKGPR
jgi:hypothetical protein